MGADARHAAAVSECTKEDLPPVQGHEVEIIVRDALNYTCGQSVRSESKVVGNFRYRLLTFPCGTLTTQGKQVSAFVEADPLEGLDSRWVFHGVKYQIAVINWLNYSKSVVKSDHWTFSKEGIDRGWHETTATAELSQESGWLGPDNSLCIRAQCYVRQADGINIGSDYNGKQETGYVGLKNHGATCYMNGLLQSLFHVGEFRRIVYSIDCDENSDAPGKDDAVHEGPVNKASVMTGQSMADDTDKAPPLIQALQNVFYKLQTSDQAVDCRELMKSFGWDTMDAFTQHDVQELSRILCDRLEEQMKGTPMDGSIKRLFEGEMENYIECIDVDYKSRRNETFYDIQLNIKSERGHELQNILESLREFTAEETLEGDNAYEAEGHGKQRAKKGIRFLTFPPVLHLQLKRFHFDLEKMDMVKLNTKFEFHKRLDLSDFAPNAGTYWLYAVVVHSGDVNSGHYYAHIRPEFGGTWMKFDDDTVTPCSEFAAVDDNFAGSDLGVWNYFEFTPRELRGKAPPTRPRIHNAYMLVYIREDHAAQILTAPDPRATNIKMVERCDREVRAAEQRRKEKLESQHKIKIKLVFERDLCGMTGFFDHADIPSHHSLKMGRDQTVRDLAVEVETLAKLPRDHVALFSLQYRSNPRQVRFNFLQLSTTFRSHIPQMSAPHFDPGDPHLVVLVKAASSYDIHTLKCNPSDTKKPDELAKWNDEQVILLVVKYFCPTTRKILTLGCHYMSQEHTLAAMVTSGWIAERLQPLLDNKEIHPLPADAFDVAQGEDVGLKWQCWEEFCERDIQPRSVKRTIKNEQLWTGDIVIWQPAPPEGTQFEPADNDKVLGKGPGGEEGTEAWDPETLEEKSRFPINTVADFAAHIANGADVVVTLHDWRQPLCVDGIVSNGVWGPQRPASAVATTSPTAGKKVDGAPPTSPAGGAPAKEERPEDVALSLSPSQFNMPQEREMKMDLRWSGQYVIDVIARAFGLRVRPKDAQLWLFNTAPSSGCEDQMIVNAALKDLMRLPNCMQMSSTGNRNKPNQLQLHVVEWPFDKGPSSWNQEWPVCVRFFDSQVREVGTCIVFVPIQGCVQDVINECAKNLDPKWGISLPLRVLEVESGRLQRIVKPELAIGHLSWYGRPNVFYHSLRVEADPDAAMPEGHALLEIYHCDRHSQQAFAQPLLLSVGPGETAGSIKKRCKDKLQVPETEFKSWRLVRSVRGGKTHLKDDEAWDAGCDATDFRDDKLALEHVHPNPTSSLARQPRYSKPLTIKSG